MARQDAHLHRACTQGLAAGVVAEGEPRDPPLDYDRVYRLKQAHPELEIIINGGIETLDDAGRHLQYLDGVMLGRAAYQTPYILADVDRRFFADASPSRAASFGRTDGLCTRHLQSGGKLNNVARHTLGLVSRPAPRASISAHLSENAAGQGATAEVLHEAMAIVEGRVARHAVAAE